MSMDDFRSMCLSGRAEPEHWEKWLKDFPEDARPAYERLGLVKEEYEDLSAGRRTFDFYVMKRRHGRSIYSLWTGCYVKYLFEPDPHNPRYEYGWVDAVNASTGYCRIQCDDMYHGMRVVLVRIIDVMEILPMKERPLVYYKTMICGDCHGCDRASDREPPAECPFGAFLSACKSKAEGDAEFLRMYFGVNEKEGADDAGTRTDDENA